MAGVSISDVFLLLVRWLHLVAAAAWVGGGLFYMLVLRPAIRRAGDSGDTLPAAVGREFRSLVGLCIAVLVLTGAILTFDRLTSPATDTAYVATLAVKVSLAVIMFVLAHRARRARREAPATSPELDAGGMPVVRLARRVSRVLSDGYLILALGVTILLLADLLKAIYESNLTGS